MLYGYILISKENINSYKRELQIMHIKMLSDMLYKVDSMPLMLFHLVEKISIKILKEIYFSMSFVNSLDYYTKSHLEYLKSLKLIKTVLDHQMIS